MSCVGALLKRRSVAYDCTEGAGEGSQWWSTERSEVRNHWNRVARGWNPERVAEMHDAIETPELMVQSLSLFQSSRFALFRDPGVRTRCRSCFTPGYLLTAPSAPGILPVNGLKLKLALARR